MQAIKRQRDSARLHGLFRAATARQVIYHFFFNVLQNWLNFNGRWTWEPDTSTYESLAHVSHVDVFISHSWSCPPLMKWLAVCHYLNLDLAMALSGFVCILSATILVLSAGSIDAVAAVQPRHWLFIVLLCCPTVVFLIAYVCGHWHYRKTFWVDQVCVDQRNPLVKSQTLQALPAFIAQSAQMLVIWDESYFTRLWCNYELAVFLKATGSDCTMYVVPSWMPLWILAVFVTMCTLCFSYAGQPLKDMTSELNTTSILAFWIQHWVTYAGPYIWLLFLAAPPVSSFCLFKLHRHKQMLDQMAAFDLRSAKCTLESDRTLIHDQVLDLFDEALEPPICVDFTGGSDQHTTHQADEFPLLSPEEIRSIRHLTSYPTADEVIDHFNAHVRGPLRDSLVQSIGKEEYLSFKHCLVVILPQLMVGLLEVLGCDGHADCATSAGYIGAPVSSYMTCNAVTCLLLLPMCTVVLCPLMLRSNHLAIQLTSNAAFRLFLGSFFTGFVLFLWYVAQLYIYLIPFVLAEKPTAMNVTALVVALASLWVMWYLLFGTAAFGNSPDARLLKHAG